jgi:hypothetical protein
MNRTRQLSLFQQDPLPSPTEKPADPVPASKPPFSPAPDDTDTTSLFEDLYYVTRDITSLFYSWFLMRLPSMYFHHVARVIRKSKITQSAMSTFRRDSTTLPAGAIASAIVAAAVSFTGVGAPPIRSKHPLRHFQARWKLFVVQCIEEWRNLNIVSTLLMG